MAYNTTTLKKDAEGKPIPQYYNIDKNAYEPLYGANGSNYVIITDNNGKPLGTNGMTVNGTIDIKTNTKLFQGNIALTGAVITLPANASKVFTIQADPRNIDYVFIGFGTVSETSYMAVLPAGSSMTFTINNTNLLKVLGVQGDKVSFGGEGL